MRLPFYLRIVAQDGLFVFGCSTRAGSVPVDISHKRILIYESTIV